MINLIFRFHTMLNEFPFQLAIQMNVNNEGRFNHIQLQ